MYRIDERRILCDYQGLASGINNTPTSPHWPRVQVTVAMTNNNKDGVLSYVKGKAPTAVDDLKLIKSTQGINRLQCVK